MKVKFWSTQMLCAASVDLVQRRTFERFTFMSHALWWIWIGSEKFFFYPAGSTLPNSHGGAPVRVWILSQDVQCEGESSSASTNPHQGASLQGKLNKWMKTKRDTKKMLKILKRCWEHVKIWNISIYQEFFLLNLFLMFANLYTSRNKKIKARNLKKWSFRKTS